MVTERALPRRHSLLSALALAALATVTFAGPADARRDRYYSEPEAEADSEAEQPKLDRPAGGQPRLAVVSLGDQRVTIYDAKGQVMQGPISSGATPNDTPPGIYAILQKNREHYSNRYDDARMPFMQRITWTGMALHGGVLPGYPASHGCIRLREDFANNLFDMTKLGMRVIVSRNNMAPSPISHPVLFKPKPFRDNVAVLTPAAVQMPAPTEEGKDTRYDGGGQNDPPELATRTSALQALSAAKAAEAQELAKKVEDTRVAFKQKQRESARAAKALKSAERAYMNAVEWQADAEKDLTRAKTEKQTKRAEDQKAKAIGQGGRDQGEVRRCHRREQAGARGARPAPRQLSRPPTPSTRLPRVLRAKPSASCRRCRCSSASRPRRSTSARIWSRSTRVMSRSAIPSQPIGTHIFTAVDYQPGGRDMKWNVVSIAGRQPGEPEKSSGMNRQLAQRLRAGASRPMLPPPRPRSTASRSPRRRPSTSPSWSCRGRR